MDTLSMNPTLTSIHRADLPHTPPPSKLTQFADQSILLAVSVPSGDAFTVFAVAVSAIGDRAWQEILATSPSPYHFMEMAEEDWPQTPGFHVWHGSIFIDLASPRQMAEWIGDWRAAKAEDYARFGLPMPRPSLALVPGDY